MNRFRFAALAGLGLMCGTAQAQRTTDPFISVFAETCLRSYADPQSLRSRMAGVAPLEGKPREFFLDGARGKAWGLTRDGAHYVLVLRDDGICALFAPKADVPALTEQFARLAGTAPPPMQVKVVKTTAEANADTHAWEWSRPEDPTALRFTLSTSDPAKTQIAAMATLARVQHEARDPR